MSVYCFNILRQYCVTKAQRDICKQVFSSPHTRVKAWGTLKNMGVLDKLRHSSSNANATTDVLDSPDVAKVW